MGQLKKFRIAGLREAAAIVEKRANDFRPNLDKGDVTAYVLDMLTRDIRAQADRLDEIRVGKKLAGKA